MFSDHKPRHRHTFQHQLLGCELLCLVDCYLILDTLKQSVLKLTFSDERHNGFIFNIDIFEDILVIQYITNMLDRW